jgi:hypothetical protein
MKYRIFTYSGDALPIAHKLQQEGCEVVVGMVHDKAAIHSAKEGELRLSHALTMCGEIAPRPCFALSQDAALEPK